MISPAFQSSDQTGMRAHEARFRAYVQSVREAENGDDGPHALKLEHTFAVLDAARAIAEAEGLEASYRRAVLLAALYHDVARFEQYLRFRTFRDADSFNHALAGVKILRREGLLAGETKAARRIILAAVGLHNRFALPQGLPRDVLLAAHIVRDADKLDILRVMNAHLSRPGPHNPTVVLGLPDDPRAAGQAVLEAVAAGRIPSYRDLTCVNDFRVLLGSWFFDMHFPSSRRRFLSDGNGRAIVAGLPAGGAHAAARSLLLTALDAVTPR